jgi:hypothetical protein
VGGARDGEGPRRGGDEKGRGKGEVRAIPGAAGPDR